MGQFATIEMFFLQHQHKVAEGQISVKNFHDSISKI